MTPQVLPGATYGEYWPNGVGVTSLTMPAGAPTDLLHFRVASDGRVIGKGHEGGHAWYWTGQQWLDLGPSDGNNIGAFHPTSGDVYVATGAGVRVYARDGNFRTLLPGGYIGSNGIRWVSDHGVVVSGDDTYGVRDLLGEYTAVGDLLIGQGIAGGLEVVFGGVRHHVCDGVVDFLRVNTSNGHVTCYWTDFAAGYVLQTTVDDLRALPPVAAPVAPPSVPPPSPAPLPAPPSEPPPMSVNHLDVVQRLASSIKPDGSLMGNFAFISAVRAAVNDGAGFVKSSAGAENTISYAGGFVRTSRLIYPDGHLYKLIGDAGPNGANIPEWADEGLDNPGLYVAASSSAPPPPVVAPAPHAPPVDLTPLLNRIAELEQRVQAQENRPSASFPAKIALRSDNGHYVCAENGGGGVLNATRTVAGPWETFTVEPRD